MAGGTSPDAGFHRLDDVTYEVNRLLGRDHDLRDPMKIHFGNFVRRSAELNDPAKALAFLEELERSWNRSEELRGGDPKAFAALAHVLCEECTSTQAINIALDFGRRGSTEFRSEVKKGAEAALAKVLESSSASGKVTEAPLVTLEQVSEQLHLPSLDRR
jgi:hypothetical protein